MEEFVVLYHDYDVLVIPITMIVFYLVGRAITRRIPSGEMKNYFIYGMLLKMLATLVFGLVIQFYFGGGDTNRYYVALLDLKRAIQDDPANLYHIYGKIKMTTDNPVAQFIANDKLGDNLLYMVKTSNFTVPRFGLLFSFIFGNSYTALSLCYSFFAFWGCWKCFTVYAYLYPQLKKGMAICFLFFPSVVYWGSAITKDSVCLGALGIFVYSFFNLFFLKRHLILHAVSLLVWGAILFFTKPYILLALLPALSIWYFLHINKSIKEKSVRYVSFGILLAVIGGAVFAFLQFILNSEFIETSQYKAENLAQYAQSSQEGYSQAGGSNFNIGTLDGSFNSFATMFPKAVNASLFRPYLWEVNNLVMLISALESITILYLFLFALFRLGFKKFFGKIFTTPILVFMFVYSVFLAGLVAITTTNFGSLVRYKIPVMPFFLCLLIILIGQVPNVRRNKIVSWILYTRSQRILNNT